MTFTRSKFKEGDYVETISDVYDEDENGKTIFPAGSRGRIVEVLPWGDPLYEVQPDGANPDEDTWPFYGSEIKLVE